MPPFYPQSSFDLLSQHINDESNFQELADKVSPRGRTWGGTGERVGWSGMAEVLAVFLQFGPFGKITPTFTNIGN